MKYIESGVRWMLPFHAECEVLCPLLHLFYWVATLDRPTPHQRILLKVVLGTLGSSIHPRPRQTLPWSTSESRILEEPSKWATEIVCLAFVCLACNLLYFLFLLCCCDAIENNYLLFLRTIYYLIIYIKVISNKDKNK